MKSIGLLSDTHGYLDPRIMDYFANCDEVWHAGDIGSVEIIDQLEAFKPVRIVLAILIIKPFRCVLTKIYILNWKDSVSG